MAALTPPRILVFSDLDGTLLDHHTYSFQPALPALNRLAAAKIPVILTTSKTLAEVQELKQRLGNQAPCIVENGSAIWIPADCFANGDPEHIEVLGLPVKEIYAVLDSLPQHLRQEIRGFRDLTTDEVAQATGLDPASAERARTRVASEPFLWSGDVDGMAEVERRLKSSGLSLKRGGRFFHAQGNVDKADALKWLANRYVQHDRNRTILTVALGDGHNDLEMLKAAGIGILIDNPDGPAVRDRIAGTTIRAAGIGPTGWNNAIQEVLDSNSIL